MLICQLPDGRHPIVCEPTCRFFHMSKYKATYLPRSTHPAPSAPSATGVERNRCGYKVGVFREGTWPDIFRAVRAGEEKKMMMKKREERKMGGEKRVPWQLLYT